MFGITFHTGTNKSWTLNYSFIKVAEVLTCVKSRNTEFNLNPNVTPCLKPKFIKNRNTEFLSAFFFLFKSMPQIEASVNIVLGEDILFLNCDTISQNVEMRDRKELLNHCVHPCWHRIAPCSTFFRCYVDFEISSSRRFPHFLGRLFNGLIALTVKIALIFLSSIFLCLILFCLFSYTSLNVLFPSPVLGARIC